MVSPLLRTALALLIASQVLAACDDAAPAARGQRVRYSYAVTPSGRVFRLFAAGPVTRGAGDVNLQIAYLAESDEIAQLDRDVDELLRAFGPEMLLTGHPRLTIQARRSVNDLGFKSGAREVVFERQGNGWVRKASPPPPIASAGPTPDESRFPLDRAKIDAAAEQAQRWLAALDAGQPAAESGLSGDFARKLAATPQFWPALLDRRHGFGMPGRRVELYRMQTNNRADANRPAGDSVTVQYQLEPSPTVTILERVAMRREQERWAVDGYAFQPIPAQATVQR